MHADLTRWTFDPIRGYRSVVMQQGRVLLDAEWNEQGEIAAHHDEVRTLDVVGRAGGAEPTGGGPGPFALVDLADGSTPAGVPWTRLGVSPGRYYVDGLLAESPADPAAAASDGAWGLADQPHLRTIGSGVTADPGLTEPLAADGDRYAAVLEVFSRLVTADEDPRLLESALGGPDTAARQQTVWQVRLEPVAAGTVCSAVSTGAREPRRLVPGLREAAAGADPCDIASGGGYQRLENQLYRVEICEVSPQPRYMWSRENGSVVATLVALDTTAEPGMDAALTLDRVGRDDGLSIRQGNLVEVTSADRQARGLPGFLGTAGPVVDRVVHVAWGAGAPTSVAALGVAPVVRRWDGGPSTVSTATQDLEGGITVRFPAGGTPAVGDYWLIPARTARLAYGVSARQGTIDWPRDGASLAALTPTGTVHHRAPLGILERSGGAWTLVSDCRSMFPPLTRLTAIDLVGGDGQEAMPGDRFDEAIRVVVRRGDVPVEGVPVRFTARDGVLDPADPASGATSPVTLSTDADGLAQVNWTPDPGGATTQTVLIERLDDTGTLTDVPIVVTGQLSVAREVAWESPCRGIGAETVQDGLDALATRSTLRLLGGDGQSVRADGDVVPELVRVVVDSPCGPVDTKVVAQASNGAFVAAVPDGAVPSPAELGAVPTQDATGLTDTAGVVAFVWQPAFHPTTRTDTPGSDVLTISLDGAPLSVTAQLAPTGSRTPGLHAEAVRLLAEGDDVDVEDLVAPTSLLKGIEVVLDGDVAVESVRGLPVGRLVAELLGERLAPGMVLPVILDGTMDASDRTVTWTPSDSTRELLLRWDAEMNADGTLRFTVRFQLDGWSVVSLENPDLHLNGHANVVVERGRTRLRLPTTDEVTGGRFEVWFRLGHGNRILRLDDFSGRTLGFLARRMEEAGVEVEIVPEEAPGVRVNTVLGTEPPAGASVGPGDRLVVRTARGDR